jgi:hypothetical protein
MTWDPIAWAQSTGVAPGRPGSPPPEPAMPSGRLIEIDRLGWLARVEPTAALGPLELELRAAGWTLGPLPEGGERMPVATALATDAATTAGTGAGFTVLRHDETSQGVRLAIRPVPAAQAGAAILLPDLAHGLEALRRLARDGLMPAEALLADRAAAGLWIAAAEAGRQTEDLLRPDDALLVLVAQGPSGAASERIATAAEALRDLGAESLGQEIAQAWAAARERPAQAAPALLAAGWDLTRREARRAWSETALAMDAVGDWVGVEYTGATPHAVLVRARRLSAVA